MSKKNLPTVPEAMADRPRVRTSKKDRFTCQVAIFEEPENPNKKPMYPKHLVYGDGKDLQLEEIRAMCYWNKVKGTGIDINTTLRREKPKSFCDMATQTEPEPLKTVQLIETSTQTEYTSKSVKEISTQTPKLNDNQTVLPKVTTRSASRAKLLSQIPTVSQGAKNIVKEELPSTTVANSATFVIAKDNKQGSIDGKKPIHPCVLEKVNDDDHSDGRDENDDTVLTTKAFKIVPSSTPFQVGKNNNKDRRKATRIEPPLVHE